MELEVGIPSSKTRQANTQPSAELDEARVQRQLLFQAGGDKDRDHEAVDTNNTSHNDGYDVFNTPHQLTENETFVAQSPSYS